MKQFLSFAPPSFWKGVLGILLLSFILYLPSLQNDFVNFDDPGFLTSNTAVKTFDLPKILLPGDGQYKPLTLLSFALEYQAAGLDPFLYHLNNLFLHLFNVLFVSVLIFSLTKGNLFISLFVAGCFALHPAHTEVVNWVSARKDTLSTFFFLLSLIFYVQFLDQKEKKGYLFSFLFFLGAIGSKLMPASLPFFLLLLDASRKRTFNRNLWLEKLPYFVLSLIVLGINLTTHSVGERIESEFSLFGMVIQGFHSIVFYLSQLSFPHEILIYYQTETVPLSFLRILLAGGTAGFLLYGFKRFGFKALSFSLGFFLIPLLTVLKVIPYGNDFLYANRYLYVPSIGFFLLVGLILNELLNPKLKKGVSFFIFPIFFFISLQASFAWRNSETLWTNVLESYPQTTIALDNLATEFKRKRNLDASISHYQKVLSINPNYPNIHNNLGAAFSEREDLEEAFVHFRKQLELDPKNVSALGNLAVVYAKTGQFSKAHVFIKKALKLAPDYPQAHFNLGIIAEKQNQLLKAVRHYQKTIHLEPDSTEAYFNLGQVFLNLSQFEKAIETFKKLVELDPNHVQGLNSLGLTYLNKRDFREAISFFEKATQKNPHFASAFNNLGLAYLNQNNPLKAVPFFQRALDLKVSGEIHLNLALCYERINEKEKMILHAKKAQEWGVELPTSLREIIGSGS